MQQLGRRRGFTAWFVEPYRQVKLGLMFLMLNLVFASLVFGIFGYYVWDIYHTLSAYFQLTSDQNADIMQKFLTPIYVGSCLLILFIIASILISVRYTYQIYGPLVSIRRFLDEYLQGDIVHPLILRESDQLQELAEKLNQVMYLYPNDRSGSNLRSIYLYLDELLAGGTPDPLTVRESDQFHPLAERINRVGKRIRGETVG